MIRKGDIWTAPDGQTCEWLYDVCADDWISTRFMKINGQTPEAAGKFPKFILYDGRQLTIDPPKGVTVTRLDCDGVIR